MVLIKDGIVKKECKFDIYKLYNYIYSRNFNNLVDLVNYERNEVSFKYEEDYSLDSNQKYNDLIKLVGLLHSKTSYNKEVSKDKYKEIYSLLKNNIDAINNYYNMMFDSIINVEDYSPSEYIFLNNYYVIDSAIKYCIDKLDEWNLDVIDKDKQRVSLVHNNLRLDHYIKNNNEYLISFDKYIIDSPVIDLYKFYVKEWKNINFKDLINEYNDISKLGKDEELLLYILICMPYKINFNNKEIDNIIMIRDLIDYLVKGFNVIKE